MLYSLLRPLSFKAGTTVLHFASCILFARPQSHTRAWSHTVDHQCNTACHPSYRRTSPNVWTFLSHTAALHTLVSTVRRHTRGLYCILCHWKLLKQCKHMRQLGVPYIHIIVILKLAHWLVDTPLDVAPSKVLYTYVSQSTASDGKAAHGKVTVCQRYSSMLSMSNQAATQEVKQHVYQWQP